MERTPGTSAPFESLPATLPVSPTRERVSAVLSFLTFDAHGLRLGLELTGCFCIFESFAAAFVRADDPTSQSRLLFFWLLSCALMAVFDYFLFLPPLKALDDAHRFSVARRLESALNALETLSPSNGRLIHFPIERFHLLRARFFSDAGRFDDAREELRRAPRVRPADRIELELEMLRGAGEFDAAMKLLSVAEESTPAVLLERALVRFEQGYSITPYGVDRASISEALKLFDEAGARAPHLRAFTTLYREACRLWLGYAEEAFDSLLRNLRTLPFAPFTPNPYSRHLGRLYLSRAYYALTHKEPSLGESDFRLGSVLLPPSQLKQLRRKIREELGEKIEAHSETHPIDIIEPAPDSLRRGGESNGAGDPGGEPGRN